jgi:ABC-type cobalamin/Fe3+-siderophores transport system ATPase subunit
MSANATLRFEDVAVHIDGREVLRAVDLALAPGEIVALAGRNGAGKTTLFRVASRVLTPSRGHVWLDGRRIDSLSPRELAARIAVVPQDTNIPFPFRAGEVVLMGRSPHLGAFGFESAQDIECARAAMAEMEIEALADRSMLELSGGERQLVLVARALAQQARVLLLDEPTAHLDLRHRTAVLERVQAFVRDGRSALVVSHDLSLVSHVCDRLALLADGELLACGPPRDVLTPEHLRATFDIEAEVFEGPDGVPLVVPHTAGRRTRLAPLLR